MAAPPPTKEQIRAALQQAGQYASTPYSSSTAVLTPENAQDVGLDPARGYVAQGTPTAAPQPPPVITPPEPPPQSVSPAPAKPSPLPGPLAPPADWPDKPVATKTDKGPPSDWPDKPVEAKPPPVEAKAAPPADWPDKPVEQPQPPTATPSPQLPIPTGPVVPTDAETVQEQIAAHMKAGKSPGEAQALVAGQEPKTVTGKTPPPKPEVAAQAPQPEQPKEPQQQAPKPIDTLKADEQNRVDPVALYSYLLGKFANSGLVGHVPRDGARWGIKTGSAAEWAAFGLAVAKQESDLDARSWNPNDPGGSAGLFQFGQGQKPYVQGDQFDPQQSADAFVRAVQHFLANNGRIANLGATFGSILRPDEAGQYIAGAQKVATGGSGKDLVSSGRSHERGPVGGDIGGWGDLQPNIPLGPSASSAPQEQPWTPSPGRSTPIYNPSSESGAGGVDALGAGLIGAALAATAFQGKGGPQQQQPKQPPPAEEEDPMVTALMSRGFSRPEAINFAQSSQTISPGKGIGPLQQPPSAPSAQGQLPAPTVTSKLLSTKQLMPGNVPKIVPAKGPAPAAPSGKAGGTQLQLPAPSAPAAPGKPAPRPTTQAPQGAQAPPTSRQVPAPPQPSRQPTEFTGAPAGSTLANPTPPGHEKLSEIPKLVDQAKHHASILSPDDPRVKKQADGKIKGEHFVGGDPFHEQLLSGLPGGKTGRQGQILAQAEQAIGEKQPLHISYISAPKEAEMFPTRESRKLQYDEHSAEARLLGTTEGQLVGHSMIPVSVGVTPSRKANEPHQGVINGISTNVLANNFAHANRKLAEMGQKSPYEKLGAKFVNDLEGYLSNLNAGHTGTGRGHAIGTAEFPNQPDENHVPYHLTRREADFLNLVINNQSAFAQHQDGQALRRLAEANGTLLDPSGETNRMRHQIEGHEPGWRTNVLEPTIRSFRAGLVHEIHASEEHMPQTIRPGKEYRDVTAAIQRTSERGRPDIGLSTSPRSQPIPSIRRDLAQNREINQIEREFSEDKITEAEAHERLRAIGEDPREYQFIGGSGGLISPYESDPTAISSEEHNQLKDNLRKKWIGGQMPIEDYLRKSAEIPLPTIASRPAVQSKEDEPGISPSSPIATPAKPSHAKPIHAAPRLAAPGPAEASQESTTTPSSEPLAAPKPKPEASEETEPAKPKPPAVDEPFPTPVKKPVKTPLEEAAPPPATKAAEPAEKLTKPPWEEADEKTRQDYLEKRVSQAVAGQSKDPRALKLKASRNEQGGVQYDPQGNPVWEKTDYDIANLPMLGKKGVNKIKGADEHEDTLGKDEHLHLNQVERRRLSAMRKVSSVKTLGDHIVDSYNSIKDIPEIAAGKGWYSRMRDKMKKHLGDDREIFAQLLGATSAKTPVRANFIQALDAYERYKEGKADPTNMDAGFNRHIAKYLEAYDKMHEGKGALLEHMKSLGIHDPEDKTDADAMASWIKHHNILPLQRSGAKYNANSNAVLKVLGGTWLKDVGAPKTPNFAGNLTGRTLAATIDVWAARHLHRIGTEDFTKGRWRPQSSAEPGVNSLDFAYSQDAMKHAADKIGINPDDLQAILWYAEKHHYEKSGWTRGQGAEKSSFDDVFDKVFENPSGQRMTAAEAQAHYQALGKAESARRSKIKTAKTQAARGDPKLAAYMEKHGLTHQEVHGDEDEEAA